MLMRGHSEPTMSVTIDEPHAHTLWIVLVLWQGLFNYYISGSLGGHSTSPVAPQPRQSVSQPMALLK